MILKIIDGVTATSLIEKKLSAYGDVRSILRSLEMAGLIRSKAVGVKQVRFNLDLTESKFSGLTHADNSKVWAETNNQYEKIVGEAPNTVILDSTTDHRESENLAAIINEMSVFVLTYLPEQSFQILKEIEEISSLEMLAATLGGYEQIISHLGTKSVQHLQQINTTLRARL